VFDHITNLPGHIAVVVSLLISLMEDKVRQLQDNGICAVNIGSQADIDWSRIEEGEYSIVFRSPEVWRTVWCNDVYCRRQNLFI